MQIPGVSGSIFGAIQQVDVIVHAIVTPNINGIARDPPLLGIDYESSALYE